MTDGNGLKPSLGRRLRVARELWTVRFRRAWEWFDEWFFGEVVSWLSWRALRVVVYWHLALMYPRLVLYTASHVARSGFSSPGVVLAYLSIVFTVVLGLLGVFQQADERTGSGWSTVVLIGSAVLALVVAIATSFLSAPPNALAVVRVEGRKASEILMVLAATIYSLVWKSDRRVRGLEGALVVLQTHLHQPVGSAGVRDLRVLDGWRQVKRRLYRFERLLERLKKDQVREIQLVEEMVQVAGRVLEIRPERLGGSILHFSPTLFRERTQDLYLKTMALIDTCDRFEESGQPGTADLYDLFESLIEGIQSTLDESARRLGYQLEVMDNRYVNDLAMEVVAARSASLAVRRYAECMAQAHLLKLPSGYLTIRKKQLYKASFHELLPFFVEPVDALRCLPRHRLAHRIRYLYRIQKAYPGVNPHILLTRLVMEIRRSPASARRAWCEPRVARRLLRALLILERDRSRFHGPLLDKWEDGGYWKELPRLVAFYSNYARLQIAASFERYLKRWIAACEHRCYIVTQGNSATVRRALEDAFAGFTEDERSRIALVCFPSEDDPHYLEPRRIIYSLAASEPMLGIKRRAAILRPPTLYRILQENDSVLLLLGTEAIDARWRFVHPNGLSKFQDGLRDKCRELGVRYESVVLAEAYKRQQIQWSDLEVRGDPIDRRVELFDAADQHVDRVILGGVSFTRKTRRVAA